MVESTRVKQEVSRTVILSLTKSVSILWLSGPTCAYHTLVPSSNPSLPIYASFTINISEKDKLMLPVGNEVPIVGTLCIAYLTKNDHVCQTLDRKWVSNDVLVVCPAHPAVSSRPSPHAVPDHHAHHVAWLADARAQQWASSWKNFVRTECQLRSRLLFPEPKLQNFLFFAQNYITLKMPKSPFINL